MPPEEPSLPATRRNPGVLAGSLSGRGRRRTVNIHDRYLEEAEAILPGLEGAAPTIHTSFQERIENTSADAYGQFMGMESHLEGTRYGWFTPGYLRRLGADVVIWCWGSPPPGCGHAAEWRWESLVEAFGERRDLWLVPWVCPICRWREVSFTVQVRGAPR